jgi:hypothetical protein
MLTVAYHDLNRLTRYLVERKNVVEAAKRIGISHSLSLDRENLKDHRAFCAVERGYWRILCSRALEDVPSEVRFGILLHEVSHLVNDYIGAGPNDEVDTDSWVISAVPESDYHYKNIVYMNSLVGKMTTARNVESVSPKFLALLSSPVKANPILEKLTSLQQQDTPYNERTFYHGITGRRLAEFQQTGKIPSARQAFGGEFSITDDYAFAKGYSKEGALILFLKAPDASFEFRDVHDPEAEITGADIEDAGEGEFLVWKPERLRVVGQEKI